MRRVIVESPYAASTPEGIEANVAYARACVRDTLSRNEAGIASHLLYTQPGILRDEVPTERQWGIDAGLVWGAAAEATVVYTDRGISRGMQYGIANAEAAGRPIEYRSLLETTDGWFVEADLKAGLGNLPYWTWSPGSKVELIECWGRIPAARPHTHWCQAEVTPSPPRLL